MSQWGTPYGAYPQYPQFQTSTRPRVDPAAAAALALAIASIIFWIAPAVTALFLAPHAKQRVRATNGATRGLGVIKAAQVISAISLAVSALLFIAFAAG